MALNWPAHCAWANVSAVVSVTGCANGESDLVNFLAVSA